MRGMAFVDPWHCRQWKVQRKRFFQPLNADRILDKYLCSSALWFVIHWRVFRENRIVQLRVFFSPFRFLSSLSICELSRVPLTVRGVSHRSLKSSRSISFGVRTKHSVDSNGINSNSGENLNLTKGKQRKVSEKENCFLALKAFF